MAGPDYVIDITGVPTPMPFEDAPAGSPTPRRSRPWLAVRWQCCQTYSRIYRNNEATAYEGRCPRCGRRVHIRVGSGGTSARFFEAC